MAEIIVTNPKGATSRHALKHLLTIGRQPDCDVVLGDDPLISRVHCKIETIAPSVFSIIDEKSNNGTYLNGQKLTEKVPMPLKPGDVVTLGTTRIILKTEGYGSKSSAVEKEFDPGVSFVQFKEEASPAPVNFEYSVSVASATALTEDEVKASSPRQVQLLTTRLKLMVEMGMSLGTTLEPDQLLASILEKLFDVFSQAERGFVLLFGPNGELPQSVTTPEQIKRDGFNGPLSFARTRTPVVGDENTLSISRTVVKNVREKRESILMSDAAGDASQSVHLFEIRSVVCAPLIANNEDLGILYLDSKDRSHRFTQEDLNLVNAVACQIAVVIRNAKLAQAAAVEAANRQNLQRFLSPQLVERVMKGQMKVELGGQYKTGTVFFSDIVGFTRMAGQMRPGDVVTLLNRYFQVMVDIIFNRNGTVDKFGGDLIMAFWDVLVEVPTPEAAAVTAAIDMQNAMFTFNCDLAADDSIVKPPEPLGHGIGLNTGEFIAGNIGGEKKLEFTVIGNAVNLAQRMEALAGRGNVFVGQGTYDKIKDRALVYKLPDAMVRNVDNAIPVYSIRGIVPPLSASGGPGTGDTSRLLVGGTDLLLSMPCKLAVAGAAPVAGLIVRMAASNTEKNGRFQILTGKPLPRGAKAELLWNLNEMPEMKSVHGEIEATWSETDGSPGAPSPKHGSVVLGCTNLPEEILQMKPGVTIISPIKHMDELVRA